MEPHKTSPYVIQVKRGPVSPFSDQRWNWKVVFADDPGTVCTTGAVFHKSSEESRRLAITAAQDWILTSDDSVEHWEDVDPVTGETVIKAPTPTAQALKSAEALRRETS